MAAASTEWARRGGQGQEAAARPWGVIGLPTLGHVLVPTLNRADDRAREYGLMGIDTPSPAGELRPLAEGPVATVYAAWFAGAEVAVKVFADKFDRDTAALLERERLALDSLRSVRAILPIDDVVQHPDGRCGVRMELCQGSLAGLLGGGVTLTALDVVRIGSALATALGAAHSVGVVHGGVTPGNVLFRRSGEVALADFGLALRDRFPRDPMHAVEYTAPETLRDDTVTVATDLYGLGAVLYTALTGKPPFPHRTGAPPSERILQVLRDEVPMIRSASVPAGLSNLVARLLAKDPAARPADAAGVTELLGKLYKAMGGAPVAQPVAAQPAPVPAAGPEHAPGETGEQKPPEPSDFDFDDFAEVGPARPAPAAAAPAVSPASPETVVTAPPPVAAGRTLIHTIGGPGTPAKDHQRRRRLRPGVLTGLGVLVVGLTVVPMIVSKGDSPKQTPTSVAPAPVQAPQGSPSPDAMPKVNLVLDPPVDQGNYVQLTWRADAELDFAVIVAGERIETMVLFAHRDRTKRVQVDPARRYCFQIRASDGPHIYTTDPVPIRGARCKP